MRTPGDIAQKLSIIARTGMNDWSFVAALDAFKVAFEQSVCILTLYEEGEPKVLDHLTDRFDVCTHLDVRIVVEVGTVRHFFCLSSVHCFATMAERDEESIRGPESAVFISTSVIRRHRRPNNFHNSVHHLVRRPIERNAVQLLEVVEEAPDHVVRNVRKAHRIDHRSDDVRQCRQRDAVVPPSAFVFHHAGAFAA